MDTRPPVQPWTSPPGFLFGCLWIAGAFAVLITTFVVNHIDKPVSVVEEMGVTNAMLAAKHTAK
jgi:hypothetical protein